MQVHPAQTLRLWDSVVTIGAFDGVHRGHQSLLRHAILRAGRLGVPSVAYTFDPPPKSVFQSAPVLTSRPEKIDRLQALGLDHAVVADFHADYAARGADDFLAELAELNPAEIWVGPDFRFGRGGTAGPEMLGEHFATRIFKPIQCLEREVISSSRVRELLARGDLSKAYSLLGWDTVVGGQKRAIVSRVGYLDYEDEAPWLAYSGEHRFLDAPSRDDLYIW